MGIALFVAEREQKEPIYQRLLRHKHKWFEMERVKGLEPSYSAWKLQNFEFRSTAISPFRHFAALRVIGTTTESLFVGMKRDIFIAPA
jgi:hypothetical protein